MKKLFWALITVISLFSAPSFADNEKSRQQFLRAEEYLAKGKHEAYEKELRGLQNYPLYPYLLYSDLRHRLTRASPQEVDKFLASYSNTWFGQDIRNNWLRILAQRENWPGYLAYYIPNKNTDLTCHHIHALSKTNPKEIKTKEIETIWYSGKDLPSACDEAISIWETKGGLTNHAIVERAKIAIQSNNIELAKNLSNSLPLKDQQQIQKLMKSSNTISGEEIHDLDSPLTQSIISYQFKQAIENDLDNGMNSWEQFSTCYQLNNQHKGDILSQVAIKLATRNDPRTTEWMQKIPNDAALKSAREWRIRNAIRNQDWPSVLKWTAVLPADERNEDIWIYWRARAWDSLNVPHKARRFYNQIAQTRSYYGFLAAQKVNKRLPLNNKTFKISDTTLHEVATVPGILRAKELYFLGRLNSARREWDFTVYQLPEPHQMAAAKIAQSWSWHESAIATASKTSLKDDLQIRFPLPHLETVMFESQKRSMDPALVYGIIRQESAFVPDAKSSVGAVGLMQVMPESAKDFAVRVWKEPAPSSAQLYTPQYNIRVGSAYFTGLVKEFNGQIPPAIAAYNAGAGRVKKWMPENKSIPLDEWIETIPYYETRQYLQHVLAYLVIYTHHLQRENKGPKEAHSNGMQHLLTVVKPLSEEVKISKRE